EARALLVDDHTRGCVPCRRALLELRGGGRTAQSSDATAVRRHRLPTWLAAAAAVVVLIGGSVLATRVIGNLLAERAFTARVASIDGPLYLVDDRDTVKLGAGDTIRARQRLRTARSAGAFLTLDDGSVIEMAPRSELELHASRRGATIELDRGNIIVHAADQGRHRLAVTTEDCRVAVKGTIFAVNAGLKGSRVSVIEGEVDVRYGRSHSSLLPGEQVTTNSRLATVAIEDEIAWSRHADEYADLLRELTRLQRDIVDVVDTAAPRTSTRLLDLAPPDTVLYIAMPNLADGLGAARQVFSSRLADSEVLRDWWQREIVATGIDVEIEASLDRLQFLGEALGDEVVVALPASVLGGTGGPVVLAEVDDAAALRALLDDHLLGTPGAASAVAVVDDPAEPVADGAEIVIWVGDDLVAAAPTADALRAVADVERTSGTTAFATTDLYARLAERYTRGVEWLIGFDVERGLTATAAIGPADDTAMLGRLGLLDATTLVGERYRTAAGSAVDAELRFRGPRHGVAAWLAEPAPLSTLDFISADASLVSAAAAKDGLELFDELLDVVAATGPESLTELERFEDHLGIDLRDDLASAIGGEGAFALDGPVLPVPTWKLVLEVYDPETLEHAFRQVIDRANAELAATGAEPITIRHDERNGLVTTTVSHPSSPISLTWTMADGYLVAGPNRAAVEHALRIRSSGLGLTESTVFRDLLPTNGFTNCSALVYRNLSGLIGVLPTGAMSGELAPYQQLLNDSAAPGLICVYGLDDRILVSGTGPSLLSLAPVLGMPGLIPTDELVGSMADHPPRIEAVSSRS
ncbi:MAG: FecR family protein, partial [Holophagae bacterium]